MSYATHVKSVLDGLIDDFSLRKSNYCNNPEKDFTRNRKLDFKSMVKLLISMEGGTINSELLSFSGYDADAAMASAFIQQRHKLKEELFADLFYEFNNPFLYANTFMGYRLIACDGSDLTIYFSDRRQHRNHQFSCILRRINAIFYTYQIYTKILHYLQRRQRIRSIAPKT